MELSERTRQQNEEHPATSIRKVCEITVDRDEAVEVSWTPASDELLTAVDENDISRVQELLKKRVGWNGVNRDGTSLWHSVCEKADPLIVQSFFDAGAEPDATNAKGQSALQIVKGRLGDVSKQSDFKTLLGDLHYNDLQRGLDFTQATLVKSDELLALRADAIRDFEETRSRTKFRALLLSFRQVGWEYTVDLRFQDTPFEERPATHQSRKGAPAPLLRGVEAVYESIPLPNEFDDPLQIPKPPQLQAAGYSLLWCSARLALSPMSIEQQTRTRDRIIKLSQRLDAMNHGTVVPVEFPDANCRMAFQGKPHKDHMGNPSRTFIVEFGQHHSQGLEVMDDLISGSRKSTWARILESRTSVGGFSGMSNCSVLESSPIRWHGHFGFDLCTLRTYTNGTGSLYFERDLFIEGRHYRLWHRVESGGAMVIDPVSRLHLRARALAFFNTFDLLKSVDVTATSEAEELSGRWIVVENDPKRLAKLEVRELAIMDNTVFVGPSGRWGTGPGTLWPVGTAEIDSKQQQVKVRLSNGKVMEPWAYRFENGALMIDQGKGQPPLVHRRPGDGVPLM